MKDILLFLAWLFVLLMPLFLLARFCRGAAWWHPKDKVSSFVEIRSPFLSRLLIGRYFGVSNKKWGEIPVWTLLPTHYVVNPYPLRLSALGVFCWVAGIGSAVYWACSITGYFWVNSYDYDRTFVSFIILILIYFAVLFAAGINQRKREMPTLITKAERKAARKK